MHATPCLRASDVKSRTPKARSPAAGPLLSSRCQGTGQGGAMPARGLADPVTEDGTTGCAQGTSGP